MRRPPMKNRGNPPRSRPSRIPERRSCPPQSKTRKRKSLGIAPSIPLRSPPAFDSSASVVCARLFLLHRPLDHSSPPPTASLPRRVFKRSSASTLATSPSELGLHVPRPRRRIGFGGAPPPSPERKMGGGNPRIIAIAVYRIPSSGRAVAAAERKKKRGGSEEPPPFSPLKSA